MGVNEENLPVVGVERYILTSRSRGIEFLRQQHDSKVLTALGSTTTAECGEKKRRPRNRFEGNYFNCGKKGHRAEDCRSAKKSIEKSENALADKKGGGRGKCYVFGGVRSTLRINTEACAEA